jgi:hypothetical protein
METASTRGSHLNCRNLVLYIKGRLVKATLLCLLLCVHMHPVQSPPPAFAHSLAYGTIQARLPRITTTTPPLDHSTHTASTPRHRPFARQLACRRSWRSHPWSADPSCPCRRRFRRGTRKLRPIHRGLFSPTCPLSVGMGIVSVFRTSGHRESDGQLVIIEPSAYREHATDKVEGESISQDGFDKDP